MLFSLRTITKTQLFALMNQFDSLGQIAKAFQVDTSNILRELLNRHQYSKDIKETVAFRMLYGGEGTRQILQELGIHIIQTIHHCV